MAGALPRATVDERPVPVDRIARPLRRLRRLSPRTVDLGLGALFVLLVAVEAMRGPAVGASLGMLAALTLVLAGCLVLRRRFPLATLLIASGALVAESFLHVMTVLSPLATLVTAYALGQYATPARARWGPLVIVVAVVGVFAGTPGLSRTNPADLVSIVLVWLMAWGLGYSTAQRREEQDRARRALERQVIAEERVRVSRELHDVVRLQREPDRLVPIAVAVQQGDVADLRRLPEASLPNQPFLSSSPAGVEEALEARRDLRCAAAAVADERPTLGPVHVHRARAALRRNRRPRPGDRVRPHP